MTPTDAYRRTLSILCRAGKRTACELLGKTAGKSSGGLSPVSFAATPTTTGGGPGGTPSGATGSGIATR